MRVAVVAANGRSGKECVKALLDAGCQVNAGTYGSHDFTESNLLHIKECNALQYGDIHQLVQGCDAIVNMIGHTKDSACDVQTIATKNCIDAMQAFGVKRYIGLTGTGVRVKGDKPSLADCVVNALLKMIDPSRLNDGINHLAVLRSASNTINWTVLRVLKLTNGKKHNYTLSEHGAAQLLTSRKTVAAAVVRLLNEKDNKYETPIIGRK